MAGVFGRLAPRAGGQAAVTGEEKGWLPYKVKDIVVPARDLAHMDREQLELAVDELAMKGEFTPPTGYDQADIMNLNDRQLRDLLRQAGDEVSLAPVDQEESSRNWFLGTLATIGGAIAAPAMKILDPVAAFGEMGASTVLGSIQNLIPGEQEYERLLKEKRAARGLSDNFNLLDWITDPLASVQAQREAWHETDAPWGTKLAMEIIFDPLNLIPIKWITTPFKFAALTAKTAKKARGAGGWQFARQSIQRAEGLKWGSRIAGELQTSSLDDLAKHAEDLRSQARETNAPFRDPRLLIGNQSKRGSLNDQARRIDLAIDQIRAEMDQVPYGKMAFKYAPAEIAAGRMSEIGALWHLEDTGEVRKILPKFGPLQPGQTRWGGDGMEPQGWADGFDPSLDNAAMMKEDPDMVAPEGGARFSDDEGNIHDVPAGMSLKEYAWTEKVDIHALQDVQPGGGWIPRGANWNEEKYIEAFKVRQALIQAGEEMQEKMHSQFTEADAVVDVPYYQAAPTPEMAVGKPSGKLWKGKGGKQLKNPDGTLKRHHSRAQVRQLIKNAITDLRNGTQAIDPANVAKVEQGLVDPGDKVGYMWHALTGMRPMELSRMTIESVLRNLEHPDGPMIDLVERVRGEKLGGRQVGEMADPLHDFPPDVATAGGRERVRERAGTVYKETRRPITAQAASFLRAYINGEEWGSELISKQGERPVHQGSIGMDEFGNDVYFVLKDGLFRQNFLNNLQTGLNAADQVDIFFSSVRQGKGGLPTKSGYAPYNVVWNEVKGSRTSTRLTRLSKNIGIASHNIGKDYTAGTMRKFFATNLLVGGGFGYAEGIGEAAARRLMGHDSTRHLIDYANHAELIAMSRRAGEDPILAGLEIGNDFLATVRQRVAAIADPLERDNYQKVLDDWQHTRYAMLASGNPVWVKKESIQNVSPAERAWANPLAHLDEAEWETFRNAAAAAFPDSNLAQGLRGRAKLGETAADIMEGSYLWRFKHGFDHPILRLHPDIDRKKYLQFGHKFYEDLNLSEGSMLRLVYAEAPQSAKNYIATEGANWPPAMQKMYLEYAGQLAGYKTVKALVAKSNTLGIQRTALRKQVGKDIWADIQAQEGNTSVRALLNGKNLGISLGNRGLELSSEAAALFGRVASEGGQKVNFDAYPGFALMVDNVKHEAMSVDFMFKNGQDARTAAGKNDNFAQASADYFREQKLKPLDKIKFKRISRQEKVDRPEMDTPSVMTHHLLSQVGEKKIEWMFFNRRTVGGSYVYDMRRVEIKMQSRYDSYGHKLGESPAFHMQPITDPKDAVKSKALREKNLMSVPQAEIAAFMSVSPDGVPLSRIVYPQGPGRGRQGWMPLRVARLLLPGPQSRAARAYKGIDQTFDDPVGTTDEINRMKAKNTGILQVLLGGQKRRGETGLFAKLVEKEALVAENIPDGAGGTKRVWRFSDKVRDDVIEMRRHTAAGDGAGGPGGPRGPVGPDEPKWEPMGFDEWDNLKYNKMADGTYFGSGPRSVKDTVTDFRDSRWRKYLTGWMKHVFGAKVGRFVQMPVDWVFGQNMGQSIFRKHFGAHAAARGAARFRGEQVLDRMQHGGDLFGYSGKFGRMMKVELTGKVPPHVENVMRMASAEGTDLYGTGFRTGARGGRLDPSKFKKIPDWEWETRRVTTMLEMPRNQLSEYYRLTPEQLEWYDNYHELVLRLQHMAKEEGYDLSEYLARDAGELAKFGPDDKRYVPHLEDLGAEINRDTGLPTTPILGSKPGFFSKRTFPTMMHGEQKGRVYLQDPVEGLKQLYEGVYGFVADKQLFAELHQFGDETAEMASKTKLGEELLEALRIGRITDPEMGQIKTKGGDIAFESFFPGMREAVDKSTRASPEEALRLKREIEDMTARYWTEEQDKFDLRDWRAFRNLIPDNEAIAKLAYEKGAAKELKDYVANMSEAAAVKGIMRVPSIWSSYVRTLSTTFDLGSPLIHGFPLLTMMPLHAVQRAVREKDPFALIKWHETPWGAGVRQMFGALRDPKVRDVFRTANKEIMAEMKEHGVSFFGSELREITGSQIKRMGDYPIIGKAVRRFEVTFNTFLDVARVEYYKGMRQLVRQGPDGKPLASDLGELAAAVNKVTGGLDPVRAGISNHQRAIESTYVMFAPMLRRATAALIFKAGESIALAPLAIAGKAELGLERRQAFSAIGSIMACMGALAYMVYASGNNKKVFDTDSADFMSVRLGESRMGIGTPFYALSRMGSGLLRQMKEDPGGLYKWDIEDHAVLKMARSMTSPSTGSLIDLIHGRNFIGDPLRDVDGSWEKLKISRYFARQGMPFWAESALYDFTGFNRLSSFGEFAGLRASPLPKSRQLKQLREIYLMGDGDDAELVRWRDRQLASGKPVTVEEAPALVIDRLSVRHDDVKELEEAMQTSRLARGDTQVHRLNSYMEALKTNRDTADRSLRGHANDFERGMIDGKTFRQKVTETSAELRGAQESLSKVFEDVIDQLDSGRIGRLDVTDGYKGDLFYDYYRSKVTDHPTLEDEYGNFRPEVFRQLEASMRLEVGDDELWGYIQRRKKRNRDFPSQVQDLYKARETLKPYWTLYEDVWKKGSWQARLVASYMDLPTHAAKKRFKEDYPRIGPLLLKYEKARLRYREAHSDVDDALVRFYDYNPVDMRAKPRRRGV